MNRRPPDRQAPPDIRDVARVAGVSTATVSRALSGRGYASEAARQRVLEASRSLGYQPAGPARSLRTARSMTIGLLVPDLADVAYVPFLRGVEHVARRHGYALLVGDAHRSRAIEREQLERFQEHRVDAIVFAGAPRERALVRRLEQAGITIVDPEGPDGPSARTRGTTEARATRALCEHLAELGHVRVAYVTRVAPRSRTARRRSRAFIDGCRTVGIDAQAVVLGSARHAPDVAGVLAPLVRSKRPVTTVVCGTHSLAPLLLRAKHAAGIRVPDDCSFVTYGDSEWAAAFRPSLSVVRRDLYAKASAITAHVIARLDDGDAHLHVAPEAVHHAEYVPRESVAAPAAMRR